MTLAITAHMLMTSCPGLKEGDVLEGKYVVRGCIGKGGMGSVFLADQPALRRQVAIKVLHPELASCAMRTQRIFDEAVAACHVRNPHCLSVIDCNRLPDGTPYIVMQYVPGHPLGRVISEQSILLVRALDVFAQILSAIGAVHHSGVIHADVKSDNFLVESIDGQDHVTMIDFGLAQFSGRSTQLTGEDGELVVSGTPDYMAPEVIRGECPTCSSDLYAAGAILYELLTGAPPFRGTTSMEVMEQHLRDDVIPPSLRQPERGISPALDRVVLRALAKQPASRFPDAAAFTHELRVAGTASSVLAARPLRRDDSAAPSSLTQIGNTPVAFQRSVDGSERERPVLRNDRKQVRTEIRDALVRGDLEQIAAGYLALADALVQDRRFLAAARELQKGIDILAAGHVTYPRQPQPADRLVSALAAIYEKTGAQRMARRLAADTDRSPTLTCPLP
jgi:serine/threonine protein kinase